MWRWNNIIYTYQKSHTRRFAATSEPHTHIYNISEDNYVWRSVGSSYEFATDELCCENTFKFTTDFTVIYSASSCVYICIWNVNMYVYCNECIKLFGRIWRVNFKTIHISILLGYFTMMDIYLLKKYLCDMLQAFHQPLNY